MNITALLSDTLSPLAATRESAQHQLQAQSEQNYPLFIHSLTQELSNENTATPVRQSAGLMFKNLLAAKDFERQTECSARWMGLDGALRHSVKEAVITSLHTENSVVGTTVGQIVAAMANIEIPMAAWDDLVPTLLDRLTRTQSVNAKKALLQTIGFICETVQSDVLEMQSNAILTAVAEGAKKEQSSMEVRYAALQALINSLAFIRLNFERVEERNYVMQIVCEATQSVGSSEVQVIGFECLVKIVGMYYDYMGLYMEKALYGLTVLGMRHDNEKVVLQAIEFWSTICEIEYDRTHSEESNLNFGKSAMKDIVPVILWVMTKQEAEDDDDEWSPSMAASTCLQLLSGVVGSEIVPQVLPFIQEHINSEDWRYRETSCMAFGSIIDGPDSVEMAALVTLALPTLLKLITDPVVNVKDTAAWTLGRICENLLQVIQTEEFQKIVMAIVEGLRDGPKIAGSCAWSITCIAEQLGTKSPSAETSSLSMFFEPLLMALMESAQRPNQDVNFQMSAYEAISVLIENSAQDVSFTIQNLLSMVLEQLASTVNSPKVNYQQQANLCGLFTSITHYNGSLIKANADPIVQTLLMVIQGASKESTVKEEAFVALGAVAGAVEENFIRYMDPLMPFIVQCLANHEDYTVCSIVLGVLGDISRALQDSMFNYCEVLINHIGSLLNLQELHRKVRPACLSAIGDISLAIGGRFEIYVHPAMLIIGRIADQVNQVAQTTQEQYDYVIDTREAIAEAYVGICQGLKQAEKGNLLINYANQIFAFLESATTEMDKSESYIKIMTGLLGDMADTIPPGHLKTQFGAPWVAKFTRDIRIDKTCSQDTKNYARWTRELIRKQL